MCDVFIKSGYYMTNIIQTLNYQVGFFFRVKKVVRLSWMLVPIVVKVRLKKLNKVQTNSSFSNSKFAFLIIIYQKNFIHTYYYINIMILCEFFIIIGLILITRYVYLNNTLKFYCYVLFYII